jgi:hypothetical protein
VNPTDSRSRPGSAPVATHRIVECGLVIALACVAGAFAGAAFPAGARAGTAAVRLTAPELDLKAAYLLGFLRYVHRAGATEAAAAEPYAIAVMGDADLARALAAAVRGRHIDGRAIIVAAPRDLDSLRTYDMVFLGLSLDARLGRALERLRGAPVLTVGESDDFVERGGMIGLFLDDRRMRFAINTGAANESGLHLSATLLSLASELRGPRR